MNCIIEISQNTHLSEIEHLKKKTITIYCSLTLPERGTGEEDYSSSSKKSSSILTWRKSDSGVTYYVCFFPYSLVDFGIPFRGNVSFFSSHCHLKDQYSINLFWSFLVFFFFSWHTLARAFSCAWKKTPTKTRCLVPKRETKSTDLSAPVWQALPITLPWAASLFLGAILTVSRFIYLFGKTSTCLSTWDMHGTAFNLAALGIVISWMHYM